MAAIVHFVIYARIVFSVKVLSLTVRNTSMYALSPKSELLRIDENNLLFDVRYLDHSCLWRL
jgi:hypothetical protein